MKNFFQFLNLALVAFVIWSIIHDFSGAGAFDDCLGTFNSAERRLACTAEIYGGTK